MTLGNDNGTDGQTYRRSATHYAAPPREEGRIKKRSEETQTLRAGCSNAEPNIFASPQTPSRGVGQPKFNLPINRV